MYDNDDDDGYTDNRIKGVVFCPKSNSTKLADCIFTKCYSTHKYMRIQWSNGTTTQQINLYERERDLNLVCNPHFIWIEMLFFIRSTIRILHNNRTHAKMNSCYVIMVLVIYACAFFFFLLIIYWIALNEIPLLNLIVLLAADAFHLHLKQCNAFFCACHCHSTTKHYMNSDAKQRTNNIRWLSFLIAKARMRWSLMSSVLKYAIQMKREYQMNFSLVSR